MPTTVTKIVDPDNGGGTDYTSLSAWEAAMQKDLVAADEIQVAECRSTSGTADTTAVTVAGWTTDATRYCQIQSTGSNRHSGIWTTSKYRLSITSGATVQGIIGGVTGSANLKVLGLQIEVSGSSFTIGVSGNTGLMEAAYNIIKLSGALAAGIQASGTATIYNNLIYGNPSSGNAGFLNLGNTGSNVTAENNTLILSSGAALGLRRAAGNVIARNNLLVGFGNTNSYSGTFTTGTDYNTTDSTDSIGTGSNNSTSQTFTFTDSGSGDYSLASGDTGARDKGTTLAGISSGFTDDIVGTARDGSGAIDCGCFEYFTPPAGGYVPRRKSTLLRM